MQSKLKPTIYILTCLLGLTLAFSSYASGTIHPPVNLGLVGYWSFDEGAGTNAGDMSGNGKTGTVSGASWTTGKRGQALSFDGTNDYVDAGNVNSSVKTISFWIQASSTTNRIIDLNGTAKVELSGGTITTSGITSPTIYVDGAESSTLDTNWHYVTITTGTGIDASATTIGKSWACGDALTYNGDSYTTVQMTPTYGSQCWLQENLRTTKKPDGVTDITTSCHASGCGSPWGRSYDWYTMMNGEPRAGACNYEAQGICPGGWHIPSDHPLCPTTDDFGALGSDGGALKQTGTANWVSPNTGATNASDWTAYPADYYSRGSYGRFWSSAEDTTTDAPARSLAHDNANFSRGNTSKNSVFAVRCVLDNSPAPYFSGKLDEVRMYSRVLAVGEVTTLYQVGAVKYKSPSNAGLVGYWAMEENTGTQAGDSSGKGKNGTLTNGLAWTTGKRGQALSFDGTDDYVDLGNVNNGVKTISFWVKASTTTNRIIDLNGTAKVELSGGTITTSGISSPTIYVDGAVGSTLDTNWHYVEITTGTGIDVSAAKLGQGDMACGSNSSFNYKGGSVTYGTVDVSGQCWMDRNLGASQAAITYNDTASYGDYFQWGRLDDNHQNSNSGTTGTQSSGDVPGHGNFIVEYTDWRNPQNNNLWQAASGYTNNPCPSGWHIPLQAEWSTAITNLGLGSCSSNCREAMASSALKIPTAGYRDDYGGLSNQGMNGYLWSSFPYSTYAYALNFVSTYVNPTNYNTRVYGFTARCLKNSNVFTPYFSGKLDEVRMYNRVLTPTEVSSLYQASGRKITVNSSQNSVVTDGLVGLWSFNGPDISGMIAYDRSGSGKNGSLTGASKTIGRVGQGISFDGTSNSVDFGNVYNGVKSVTFWVKTSDTSDNGYFGGKLDEVRFYNRALSAAEIRQLYGGGSGAALTAVRPNTKMIVFNSTASVKAVNGTITASGFSSPIIYVDGTAATTIDDNWRFVAVTSGTGINATSSTLALGYVIVCGIDTLDDSRDGKSYATVQIGSQCWMKQNMNIGTRIAGSSGQGTDCSSAVAIQKYCYDDLDSNCNSNHPNYPDGGFYYWNQAMCGAASCNGTGSSQPACSSPTQGICPAGWHIPSHYEFVFLERAVCTSGSCATDFPYDTSTQNYQGTNEGTKLKVGGSANFEANMGGYHTSSNWFWGYDSEEVFYSSTDAGPNGWYRILGSGSSQVYRGASADKNYAYSIRCVKD
jgi:uncharacterized protein (TIGR02145 family)